MASSGAEADGALRRFVPEGFRRLAHLVFAQHPRSLRRVAEAGDLLGHDVLFEREMAWVAEEHLAAPVPPGWQMLADAATGALYYYHAASGETSWESPADARFKALAHEVATARDAAGKSVFGLASRAAARRREQAQRAAARADAPVHNPDAKPLDGGAHALEEAGKRALEAEKKAAASGKRRRSSVKFDAGADAVGPAQLRELAELLGIKLDAPGTTGGTYETGLMHWVQEYLDRSRAGALPEGWVEGAGDDGTPWYYNNATGEYTYDYPLTVDIQGKVAAERAMIEADAAASGGAGVPASSVRGGEVDRWWCLSNGRSTVYYYNLVTGERRVDPPDLGAKATTLVQKRVRGFLARARVQAMRRRAAVAAGGAVEGHEVTGAAYDDGSTAATPQGKDKPEGSNSVVVVHGRELDAEKQQETLAKEAEAWEREKAQRAVLVQLEAVIKAYKENIEFGGDGTWDSTTQYAKVLDMLKEASRTGLAEERDEFSLGGPAVVREVQGLVERYERMEGRRRAEANRQRAAAAEAQQLKVKLTLCKQLDQLQDRLKRLQKTEFTTAVHDKSLNGLIYDAIEVSTSYQEAFTATAAGLDAAPRNPHEKATDVLISKKQQLTQAAKLKVGIFERELQKEIQRRQSADEEARRRIEKENEEERARREEEERRRAQEAEDAKNAEQRALEERAELERKLKADYAAKIEAQRQRKIQMEEERKGMEQELTRIREARDRREQEEAERLERWSLMTFASEQDRLEAEAERRDEDAARAMEEERRRADEAERTSKLRETMERRRKEINEQRARIAAEEEEARLAALRLAEERAAVEADFQAEREKRERKARLAREAEEAKARDMEMQRAMVDEGDSDTEEEKAARAEARRRLSEYRGDVWTACRDNDLATVKAFFLVHGSGLLNEHSKAYAEGGRTLLHLAAWWGCDEVLRYLVTLGGDVNITDTVCNKATPLFESVRAGRRFMSEFLLESGADIRRVDAHGDTVLHWAARRGWGSLLIGLLRKAERVTPGVSRGLIKVKNIAGKTCQDCAKNETIREMVAREIKIEDDREMKRTQTSGRLRRGLLKARIMGANVGGTAAAIKAQRLRYGKVRSGKPGGKAPRGTSAGSSGRGSKAGAGGRPETEDHAALDDVGGLADAGLDDLGVDLEAFEYH